MVLKVERIEADTVTSAVPEEINNPYKNVDTNFLHRLMRDPEFRARMTPSQMAFASERISSNSWPDKVKAVKWAVDAGDVTVSAIAESTGISEEEVAGALGDLNNAGRVNLVATPVAEAIEEVI